MLFTIEQSTLGQAPVDQFELLRDIILSGTRLAEVKALEISIARYGLRTPLTVMEMDGRYIVLDGRKRLAALRRLAFKGKNDHIDFDAIPFRISNSDHTEVQSKTAVIASSKLYDRALQLSGNGLSAEEIATRFNLSFQCVRDLLSLGALHPHIRNAFFSRQISTEQAKAYVSIPSEYRQISLFRHLGPGACSDLILRIGHGYGERAFNNTIADAVAA